jgi:hypothetical protein
MPTRKIGAADVTNLPGTHQIIQRAKSLLDGSPCIKTMQLEKVDMIGSKPAKAPFHRLNEMIPGRTDIVRS